MTGQVIKQNGVMAMESIFGWLLSGPISPDLNCSQRSSCLTISATTVDNDTLNQALQRFWEIDSFGKDPVNDDDDVMKRFEDTIRFDKDEGRYVVQFQWKRLDIQLPDNYRLCKRRLQGLVCKLRKIGKLDEYDATLKDQYEKKFIEIVEKPEEREGPVHYLPHFAVLKEDSSTTKLRIVYDASAKASKGMQSLNDLLYTGPSLLPELISILIMVSGSNFTLLQELKSLSLSHISS